MNGVQWQPVSSFRYRGIEPTTLCSVASCTAQSTHSSTVRVSPGGPVGEEQPNIRLQWPIRCAARRWTGALGQHRGEGGVRGHQDRA